MSLIHWWPLNGDACDRITNTQLTNNGATVINNGKIGPCYTFNGSTNLTIPYSTLNALGNNPAKFSFTFWIKLNSTWTGWGQVFAIGRNGTSWTDIRIGFDIASDKTGYFTISDGSTATSYNGPKHTLTVDKWYHVAATFDNKEMKLFINGQPALSPQATASVLPSLSSDTIIAIGGNSSEKGECDINDVRIYDHALSQAEVKELSKALVVHYTFNDVLAEPTTNIIAGIQSAYGNASLETGRVKINWSPSGGDSYFMFNCIQTIKANSVYTLSFDCEGLKSGEVATFAISNLDAATYNIELKNGRNSLTFTAGSDLMNDINTYNRLFFDDRTRTDGAVFYLSNFQLEERDHATPYTPINRESMLVNETGLIQPNSSTIQNIQLVTNAAINTYSLRCNNTKILTPITGDISQGATLSLWINLPKDSNGNNIFPSISEVVAADNNSQLALGFFNGAHGIITCAGFQKSIMTNLKSALVNGWNHITIVRDSDNNIKGYLNGTEYPLTDSQEWTHSESYFSIGCRYSGDWTSYYNGQVDDIRLYHSVLSPEEIKDLCNCGGRISNLGDAFTGEFIEDTANAKINKNHTIQMNEFIENDEGKASIKKGNILSSRQIIEI